MYKLVSIITPCYNGERYLERYFTSLLNQTYPNVEVIFINDGSADDTEAIALDYGKRLQEKGYIFKYIYQDNAGQSAAINRGLKFFSGEYLTWMDSDDYLMPSSIKDKVFYLDAHQEVGIVSAKVAVNFNGVENPDNLLGRQHKQGETALFMEFLDSDFNWCPLSFMVRAEMFRDAMPNPLQIRTPRACGQNAQLLLPIWYRYPMHYIDSLAGYYVVHSDSHSHSINTFEKSELSINTEEELLYGIIDDIEPDSAKNGKLKKAVRRKIISDHLDNLSHFRRKDNLELYVRELKKCGGLWGGSIKKVLKIKHPGWKAIADRIWRLRNK